MANNLPLELFSQRFIVGALKLDRLTGRKFASQLVERKKFTWRKILMKLSFLRLLQAISPPNVASSYTHRCAPQLQTQSDSANMRYCRPQTTNLRQSRPCTRKSLTTSYKYTIEASFKNRRRIFLWSRMMTLMLQSKRSRILKRVTFKDISSKMGRCFVCTNSTAKTNASPPP